VSFATGKYNYTVFDYYEGDDEHKKPYCLRGVRVWEKNSEGKETEFKCTENVMSNLHVLEGIIPVMKTMPLVIVTGANWYF